MNLHFLFFFVIKELQTCNNNRIWLHLCNISLDREMQTLRFFTDRILLFYLISEACIMHCTLSLLKGMSGSCLILLIIVGFFPDNILYIQYPSLEPNVFYPIVQAKHSFVSIFIRNMLIAHWRDFLSFSVLILRNRCICCLHIFFWFVFVLFHIFFISAVFLHFS